METGNRKDADGNRIPRDIIHTFTAHYDDQLIFKAEFGPGISANPFISFFLKVPGPGELWVSWKDDAGGETIERYPLNVV
jgi:sulfur-oxidizing protein SoxZ